MWPWELSFVTPSTRSTLPLARMLSGDKCSCWCWHNLLDWVRSMISSYPYSLLIVGLDQVSQLLDLASDLTWQWVHLTWFIDRLYGICRNNSVVKFNWVLVLFTNRPQCDVDNSGGLFLVFVMVTMSYWKTVYWLLKEMQNITWRRDVKYLSVHLPKK